MIPVRRNQNWLPGVFNDFFGNEWIQKANETSPAMNIAETDKAFQVEIAVPGLTKADCSLRLENEDELLITVEKKQEQKEEDKQSRYLRREFTHSRFQRTLLLSDEVSKERIEAKVEHGVLTILIPKIDPTEQQKLSKQIQVQ